jgi:hypothetical protein
MPHWPPFDDCLQGAVASREGLGVRWQTGPAYSLVDESTIKLLKNVWLPQELRRPHAQELGSAAIFAASISNRRRSALKVSSSNTDSSARTLQR